MKLFLKIAMFVLIADTLLLYFFGRTPSSFVKEQNSEDFKHTKICASPDVSIESDTSLLYCIAAPVTWDTLKKELKTDTIIASPFSQTAENLNNFKFDADAVPEEFTAISVKRVADEITIESKLSCSVKYQNEFLSQPEGVNFNECDREIRVKAFGFRADDAVNDLMRDQVSIYDYKSSDDFIIEISLKKTEQQVFLAKIPPEITLSETIMTVLQRIKTGEKGMCKLDSTLLIPKIKCNVMHHFHDLEKSKINGVKVIFVKESIVFSMDKSGVELDSFFEMKLMCADMQYKSLIFDRPFLVLLKKREAQEPYFAAWIGNTELMELIEETTLR